MADPWIPDERYRRSFGPYEMVSLRARGGGESAHLLTFGDGRGIRVVPDGHTSGRYRNQVLGDAMTAIGAIWSDSGDLLASDGGLDPVVYIVGVCEVSTFKWESVGDERDWFSEWLTDWFDNQVEAGIFIKDLDRAGWVVTRKEDG